MRYAKTLTTMQEASAQMYQPFTLGLSPRITPPLNIMDIVFTIRLIMQVQRRSNPGASPLELLALLLFAEPSVLTLQKLLVFDALGERSHQLTARQKLPYAFFIAIHHTLYKFFG